MTLENNPYEEAFGQLMKILMCENSPIFDAIIKREPVWVFRKEEFGLVLLRECWVQWLSQNVQKTKNCDIFKEKEDDLNESD